MIESIILKPGEWYSMLKRITRFDQGKSEELHVEEISHLSNQEQAERIADKQAEISNLYKEVQLTDIVIPPFSQEDIPQFSSRQVKEYILRLKSNKSTPPGDIPVKIIKEFSECLSIPLCDIINRSLNQGHCLPAIKRKSSHLYQKNVLYSQWICYGPFCPSVHLTRFRKWLWWK